MEQVKKNIKKLLIDKNEKMGSLVEATGLSATAFYYKLNGKRDWKLGDLEKIAKVLQCEVVDLVKNVE